MMVNDAIKNDIIVYYTTWHVKQYNTIQYTTQHNTTQHNTTQHNKIIIHKTYAHIVHCTSYMKSYKPHRKQI